MLSQGVWQCGSQGGVLEYPTTESNTPDPSVFEGGQSPSTQAADQAAMKTAADGSSWFSGQPVSMDLGKKVYGI
jgi:hypothetical protein